MENTQENKSVALDWIIFFVSTAIMIAMLIWMDSWFWLVLPFSLTYLVRALRMM